MFSDDVFQATNEVVGRVPKATKGEMLSAVDSCSRAFPSWSETSILSRQQIFLRYQQLIKDNIVRKSPTATFVSEEWTEAEDRKACLGFCFKNNKCLICPVIFLLYFRKNWLK